MLGDTQRMRVIIPSLYTFTYYSFIISQLCCWRWNIELECEFRFKPFYLTSYEKDLKLNNSLLFIQYSWRRTVDNSDATLLIIGSISVLIKIICNCVSIDVYS